MTYLVEGKTYLLQPMDILLVSRNLIHLPTIDPEQPYERMVLWVRREFLARYSREEADLAACLQHSAQREFHLYRPRERIGCATAPSSSALSRLPGDPGFAGTLLADTCVLQLMIALNRDMLEQPTATGDVTYRFDPKIEEVTHYIRDHLGEELSIDRRQGPFFSAATT